MSSGFGASLSSEERRSGGAGGAGEMAGWGDVRIETESESETETETEIPADHARVDDYASEHAEARLRAAESLGYSVRQSFQDDSSTRPQEYDTWLLEKRVKFRSDWGDEDVGDSCCFGTRTVDMGMDCIWKLHGGV